MQSYEYVFTALKGRQGNREYYMAMCPLKMVPKIFTFESDELPPEIRSQRILNKARIPEITNYIVSNKGDYTFSSLTATIDGNVQFEPLCINDTISNDVGKLRISMDAKVIINDGQHRRAAIEKALLESSDLGDETISILLYIDIGLKHTQQMFADLNKHAVKPTRSIGILYDHRDPLSTLAREIVEKVDIFRQLTEMEKTSISNRSPKLFTLSSIYQGTQVLLKIPKKIEKISSKDTALAIDFWKTVCKHMKDWQLAANKDISTSELRKEYIHSHALAMHVIGKLGAELLADDSKRYKTELKKLEKIDWSRKNQALWEGRAMVQGRICKSNQCVILTTNYLKKYFNIELKPDEKKAEAEYLSQV